MITKIMLDKGTWKVIDEKRKSVCNHCEEEITGIVFRAGNETVKMDYCSQDCEFSDSPF